MKIYLAGPDVFLPHFGKPIFDQKKALCARYGHEGLSPMDGETSLAHLTAYEQGLAIYRGNVAHMRACDAVIANMTPFRGVSMDSGTCFEMGFMAALGKPVLGYTHRSEPFAERSQRYYERRLHEGLDPYSAGTSIERFDLADNLMMAGAVEASGFNVIVAPVAPGTELTSTTGFEFCLQQLNRSRY